MADKRTVFQKLTNVVIGTANGTMSGSPRKVSTYNILPNDSVLGVYNNKETRDKKLAELKQEKLLAYQWAKTGYETSMQQLQGATQVKVMYRDADLMDMWPEIGSALDTVSEEATVLDEKGKMINIFSDSPRVKAVLEDLFINRLDCNIILPMVTRATAKYGNEFMFLNISSENGVMGWRELPVHEMKRVENGMQNSYTGNINYSTTANNLKPDEVRFVWEGHNETTPYKNWQVAHFRLIKDSLYLPYGVSYLNKARRHWRMLSMMEDAMLLYRLEKSLERRIYKVNVGLIDDKDVPAFLQEFMNNVKRAPMIDPQTGQMDLRKNFLDVSADYVIPVRSGQDPSSIEVLQSNQNQTAMDDIKFIENKVFTALRMPKMYTNFEEAQGKGQNMANLDIRFSRVINSIQQSIIMELTKIAVIHLYLLGFEDDLTNFSISLNNPSTQLESLMLDNLTKKLGAAAAALAQQGGGIPLMSWHKVQKDIMGLTDNEISDMLQEIRLESAIAMELPRTAEIIKRTRLFDKVDRIYGEPGAEYSAQPPGQEGGMGDMGGLGGGMPMDMGEDMLGDMGEPGADDTGDIGGDEGGAALGDMGGGPLNESKVLEQYLKKINENSPEWNRKPSLYDKSLLINETLDSAIKGVEKELQEKNGRFNEILAESINKIEE